MRQINIFFEISKSQQCWFATYMRFVNMNVNVLLFLFWFWLLIRYSEQFQFHIYVGKCSLWYLFDVTEVTIHVLRGRWSSKAKKSFIKNSEINIFLFFLNINLCKIKPMTFPHLFLKDVWDWDTKKMSALPKKSRQGNSNNT